MACPDGGEIMFCIMVPCENAVRCIQGCEKQKAEVLPGGTLRLVQMVWFAAWLDYFSILPIFLT